MTTPTRIASDALTASISADGAELVSLTTADGLELLWNGDARWWTGRSPLLFPIVGRLGDDTAWVDGVPYRMPQHGFARHTRFTRSATSGRSCTFELTAEDATLAVYPRQFLLRVQYVVEAATLSVVASVTNLEAERALPFSFGFHPAFRWPLEPGRDRGDYALTFAAPEPGPIRRPIDGLLSQETEPSPVRGAHLPLADALFERGALVFRGLTSRAISYGRGSGANVRIAFVNLPDLGIWTKPGAPFVCIEPWHGFASPVGFSGELDAKPGIVRLGAGKTQTFEMHISFQRE